MYAYNYMDGWMGGLDGWMDRWMQKIVDECSKIVIGTFMLIFRHSTNHSSPLSQFNIRFFNFCVLSIGLMIL